MYCRYDLYLWSVPDRWNTILRLKGCNVNKYNCYWKGHIVEVESDTSYNAQTEAIGRFTRIAGRKKVKPSDITVMLTEKDGKEVTHSTGSID